MESWLFPESYVCQVRVVETKKLCVLLHIYFYFRLKAQGGAGCSHHYSKAAHIIIQRRNKLSKSAVRRVFFLESHTLTNTHTLLFEHMHTHSTPSRAEYKQCMQDQYSTKVQDPDATTVWDHAGLARA
jgi:hypothetical protein